MAPLSLRIVQDGGTVTKKVKLEPTMTVREAHKIVREKTNVKDNEETYGLFLRSPENEFSGVWMEEQRTLAYYMLREGDRVDYMSKIRNLRIKMLDDSVKTMQVDQSKLVADLMLQICGRLGITNHAEYGLCLEKEEEPEESKERGAGQTGTLTLKKKTQIKDRDLEFEQLSKKLKTDDNVEWIDAHKTLSEACISPQRTVVLMRKLFYSDRNVDERDPVSLNLLYVQARDDILSARHPVTEDQAVEFAGIQCQIHFGDFQEDKHKSGFIENLKEYMPEHYVNGWNIEKKVLKEYRKHQGLSSVEAKHLYIKTVRALPTYGVTFFLVKEKQKDKKKLVPRLLGINSEAILRLDETSKEILQQWPLTHVKTYHASKGEIFTLNFGDYSDKEYSVKTCDAYKIRDILEAYIDLIRQRMMAPSHGTSQDSSYITQDNITCSQANVVQHISSGAMQVVDKTFVGPSSIISTELGEKVSEGAQYVTVQQMFVSDKGQHSQQAIKSEIGLRGDMSIPFTRRLNRLNSNSVKIVNLLTEPSDTRMGDARKIVDEMNADLPFVREGVQETIEKQTNDEEKKKLQGQMQELDELMKLLSENTTPGTANACEAGDAAMRIADVTTHMHFALNTKLKRRSIIISHSRPSFVEDENTQKTLRKASFIAASATAVHSTHESNNILHQEYTGPALDAQSRAEVEASAVDKLGKVNAAIAHYIMAYSDPNNVDYDAAINSMNTINEIMPEYAKDAQALASCKDPKTKEQILLDSRALCDIIRTICSATESEDKEKMQQSIKDYTDTSGRLVFVFSKGKNNAKENEMLDLADEVAAETSKLLMMAQELTQLTPNDPAALDVDTAGVKTADAAKDLITQVQLAAPTIHSAHCQSAVTAAAEGVSSAVQQLAASWKPLEASHHPPRDTDLHHQVMEVARALDRLKGAYSELGGDTEDVFDNPAATQEQQRLKFIRTVDGNKNQWQEIDHLIAQPTAHTVNDIESEEAHNRLSRRLGQLNAAIASLLAATADREHADYGTAELAVNTINELMPLLVQDSKLASANKDADARAAMVEHIRALCDASRALCVTEDTPQNRSEAIAKFTNASGKLVFGASHRGNPDKEQKVLELTEEAYQKAFQLVSGTDQLASALGGKETALLASGAKCTNAAEALRTTAQVTAHSISEPRCQTALLTSVDKLSSAGQDLADSWRELDRPKNQVEGLETTLGELQKKLGGLKGVCGNTEDLQQVKTSHMGTPRDQQKMKFIETLSVASEQIQRAQKALEKPLPPPQTSDKSKAVQHRLSGRLGELNAAIASLLVATNREEPDYKGADDAARRISELMPYVVQDTQLTCANKDAESRAAMLDLIRELCEASRAVCNKANGNNSKDLSDAVFKFSDASGKLVYVVNPRANALRESQIMGLTASAGNHVSQLLAAVEPLSQSVDSQGPELDACGAAVADAAQALVATAQVVAPSMSEPHSKAALLSSVDQLAVSNQLLADSWKPLLKDPKHQQQTKALEKPHQQLLDNLEALRKACLIPDTEVQSTQHPTDANKLEFIATISAAREKIQNAQKALDKPIPPPLSSDKAEAVQLRLSGRLGELNAAIAALLNATADRERPDYKTAEQAVKTISELLPHVVQDTHSSCAKKDAATRAAILDVIRELCEASGTVCAGEDANDPQALNNAVTKFSEATGKLVYVVNPRVNSDRERQINSLTAGACQRASHLLAGVQQLAQDVGGTSGSQLDSRGAGFADAAQTLAHTTQITAASISELPCKKALLLSIDKMSSSSQQLADTWRPFLQDPTHQQQARTLEVPQEHLEIQLEELKKACQMPDGNGKILELSQDLQRLQFLKTVSGAREQLEMTQKALIKPIPPPLSSDKAEAVQLRLSGRLGELNAAIAALLNATADRERPDYKTAEEAIKTISELLPHVVQDTQSTCANSDAAGRAAMLDHIRELCEASRAVCAHAHDNNPQALDDAVSKWSTASNKLVYVVNPRSNADRQKQIMDLSMDASKKAGHLLSTVQKLPTTVEGKTGLELEAKSRCVDDAAYALVATARVTAPTISAPQCKQAMLSTADKLSSAAQDLVSTWKPLLQGYSYSTLRQPLQQLETKVDELKTACEIPDGELQKPKSTHKEDGKLQFTKTMSNAQQQIQKAQKALDRPLPPPSADKADLVKQRLAGRLGELNAAIAALLTATADREKPDYKTAEQAAKNITELMPHVVQDTQSTCANTDAAGRAAMLDLIRELCEASRAVCDKSNGNNTKGLTDAVTKFSDASGKLVYVVNPKTDGNREKQILSISEEACAQTSLLLSGVQKLSEAIGGSAGRALDDRGAAVADAAQALLASAQITAPTIDNPHCRTALTSSADQLASSCKHLSTAWQPLLQDARHGTRATELQLATQQLEVQLDALKRSCGEVRSAAKKKAPAAPARSTSVPCGRAQTALEATREFLHRLRTEESQGHKPRPPTKGTKPPVSHRPAPPAMTDDDKRQLQLFVQSVEEAGKSITKAEDDLKQSSKSQSVDSAISAGECMAKQARLQRNIALAGVEVASLVGANYADKIDYTMATKSTQALPQLMSAIVEDGRILSSTANEESRRAFMQEMLQMCGAARNICDAAKNDREKLNEAAIEFGDKSAKLLYIVSNDVDPTLEKEIITRAKAIGDSLAHISVKAGSIASDGGACADAVPTLCAAGARAQDAAGKLIYTAKLVAPSIYESSCQQALYNSADNLTTELRGFTESWQPFASDPQHGATVKDLGKEADNLERILEGLKGDVKGGRIGQLREIQKLVVEDTPMRQLTVKIMEDAKKLSESPELTPALKRDYVGYCKKLSDALRALDLANAKCKRTPHDTNKRRELENAIQNLQFILLQSRPTRGDKERSNIVDLNDFIDEVTAEADKLAATSSSLKVPVFADKKTLENINNNAQKISKAAYTLTHRDCESGFDTSYDNILDVDQFGKECDEIVADIDRQLQSIEDAKARNALLSKILPLTESCNMLRFATKSGISASKGVSLESTLDDLDDIESRVIKSIVKDAEVTAGVTLRSGKSTKLSDPMASINLSRAVCESQGCIPRAPVTAYIASAAASADTDTHSRNQLLKHLYKLVHLLKTQTVTASQRLATWQPVDHPAQAAITQQVLQEIQNPESKFQPETDKVKRIVNESDLTKLLVPAPAKVFGDTKQQEDKLTQFSTKLNSMSGTLMLGIASPESLTRSAHAASDAAVELAAVARGCKDNKDPVQCERIEEAVQNMTFTTYGLLKTAELACGDQDNPNARRRLTDAIGGLNQAIRRLMQTASTASPLHKECTSLTLALAAAALQSAPAATSALPFQQCCDQLAHHQETIHKLRNDQPMSRQEFARSLTEVNEAVCQTSAISSQCAYLISVSEKDSEIAEKGPVDVPQIQKCIESLQDACMLVIGSMNIQQAKEETEDFKKRIDDFSRALDEAQLKVKDGGVKATLTRAKAGVTTSAGDLSEALQQDQNMDKVTPSAVNLLEEVNRAHALIERCPLVPSAGTMSPDTKARCDELSSNNKSLITHTLALVKEVSGADDDETMTWVTFNTSKTRLIDAYDALLKSIRVNGQRAGILEGTPEDDAEEDAQSKTYLDTQVDLANKWLKKPMCKVEVKSMGQQAVRHVIDIATKMSEDLKGSEREEIRNVITETEELLTQCSVSYDNEKYTVLMDRIKELKKAIQRGVVTRVVEDFIEVDDPVADLDIMVDSEPDAQKRAFLLERKIAELLAQLGRVTRTARCVADAGGTQHASAQILHCTEQTELLAPMLVQAAQERIACPDNKAVIDNYKALLAKYAESISKVRDLCDRAVDPMDFVQTAGEAMQRLREESSTQNDVQKGQRTSEAIIKLANRSIDVSMSSLAVRRDPELRAALQAAQRRVLAATPAADCRASRLPDWKESTAEVLRTTGEVESALGGENIFKKKPTAQQGSNQQIYSVARDLHESVKDWSSRDNEIVAVARRMAVLMARLSEYMETDKKQAVITTSKSIVSESHEVAALARKLAHECTDVRIKTNLLQTCERIPTISAQLKMLTTVKSSTLGQQGTREDTEAMDMLVGNAESLMLSIQEVVKAAAGASVKIMSQRGPRLRWVRKNYY